MKRIVLYNKVSAVSLILVMFVAMLCGMSLTFGFYYGVCGIVILFASLIYLITNSDYEIYRYDRKQDVIFHKPARDADERIYKR
jgi:uncharacterized membrane protein